MTPALVIFDVDGTLVDSQGHIMASIRRAFAAEGLPCPPREVALSGVGLSIEHFMARIAPEGRGPVLAQHYRDAYATLRQAGTPSPLYPGTAEMLARLHARPEVLLAVATGKSRRGLNALIEEHDWGPMLISHQSADEHPSKPHPSMVQTILADTGIAAERSVMVGDTSYDMDMARAAGIRSVGVPWGYHPVEELRADAVIDDWDGLDPALGRLWGLT